MDVSNYVHALAVCAPGNVSHTHGTGLCVGLKACLDTVKKRSPSWPCRKSHHDSSAIQGTANHYTKLSQFLICWLILEMVVIFYAYTCNLTNSKTQKCKGMSSGVLQGRGTG
jgi:hypothetical protein